MRPVHVVFSPKNNNDACLMWQTFGGVLYSAYSTMPWEICHINTRDMLVFHVAMPL